MMNKAQKAPTEADDLSSLCDKLLAECSQLHDHIHQITCQLEFVLKKMDEIYEAYGLPVDTLDTSTNNSGCQKPGKDTP